jgi:hypothetical protein
VSIQSHAREKRYEKRQYSGTKTCLFVAGASSNDDFCTVLNNYFILGAFSVALIGVERKQTALDIFSVAKDASSSATRFIVGDALRHLRHRGRIDLAMTGFPITPERAAAMLFSDSHLDETHSTVTGF